MAENQKNSALDEASKVLGEIDQLMESALEKNESSELVTSEKNNTEFLNSEKNEEQEFTGSEENSAINDGEGQTLDGTIKSSFNIHREATLDFSVLSSDLTVEDVENRAQKIENENLAAESPLDKYVRRHREEVENVKASFATEIDELIEKERQLVSEETSKNEETASLTDEEVSEETAAEVPEESLAADEKISEESPVETPEEFLETGEESFEESPDETSDAVTIEPLNGELSESEVTAFDEVRVFEPEEAALEGEILPDTIESVSEFEDEVPVKHHVIFPLPMEADHLDLSDDEAAEDSESPKLVDRTPKRRPVFDPILTTPLSTPVKLPSLADGKEDKEKKASSVVLVGENEAKSEENKKINKKTIIIAAAVIIVLAGATTGALVYKNQQKESQTQQNDSAAINSFKTAYNAFFTNSSHTALKNSNFDKLSELGSKLDALSKSDKNYTLYQSDYQNLTDDISAIGSVNGVFSSPAIVDGKLNTQATVKDNVTLPTVSSKNSALNKLLQAALDQAKSQQTAALSASEAASSASAASSSAAAASSAAASKSVASSSSSATSSGVGVYSQNPTGATPNNSGSRVPIQSVDPNSPAFSWNSGVLARVISECQAKGYISGNNYILQAVAIGSNGDGWYNLYAPDGRYLVSIDCKTGFFAGNGGKYATIPF